MTCSRAVRIYTAISCPRCDLFDNNLENNNSEISKGWPPHRQLMKSISSVLICDDCRKVTPSR